MQRRTRRGQSSRQPEPPKKLPAKKHGDLVSLSADLTSYPTKIYEQLFKELTLGDLHGNVLKLLFFLIQHGIVDFPDTVSKEATYRKLVEIYQTPPDQITKENIALFAGIISQLKIKNKNAIRLIGDELADRGMYDPFTLLLLEKLGQERIPLTILASNHGFEFYIAYKRVKESLGKPQIGRFVWTTLSDDQARSLDSIDELIKRKLINENDIISLYENAYIPHLKLIDYALDEKNKTLTFFMHAVSGLTTIKNAAEKFGLEYKGDTVEGLIETIDKINEVFVQKIKDLSLPIDFFDPHFSLSDRMQTHVAMEHPFARIIWNRTYSKEEDFMPAELDGYSLQYVHGHNGPLSVPHDYAEFVTNLDEVNELGRPRYDQGDYTIYAQTNPRYVLEEKAENADVPTLSKEVAEDIAKDLLETFKTMQLLLEKIKTTLDQLILERKEEQKAESKPSQGLFKKQQRTPSSNLELNKKRPDLTESRRPLPRRTGVKGS